MLIKAAYSNLAPGGLGAPLRIDQVATPEPKPGQVLVRVVCGVCRTDLHVKEDSIDGAADIVVSLGEGNALLTTNRRNSSARMPPE